MRILFFNPPGKALRVEPLGLEYLVSVLKEKGFLVRLLDATIENLDAKRTADCLLNFAPDIVGVSMTTPGLIHDIKGVQLIKKVLPNAKIMVGGPHPSADPVGLLEAVPEIDWIVVGEGEETVVELCNNLVQEKSFQQIPGIAFRENGSIKVTQARKLIANIDALPFPCRDFIDYKKVFATLPFGRRRPFAIVITGRGCPYDCIFCTKSVFGRSCRLRSVDNVMQEIEQLVSRGVKEIRFYDDIFTVNLDRAIKICLEIIRQNFRLSWTCESRVDTISEELLGVMKKAGCYNVTFGVESGSQKVLERSHKGITVSQIKNAFQLCRRVGMESGAWFLFGLPGETEETLKETSELISYVQPDFIAAGIAGLLPNTELYEIAKKENPSLKVNWYKFGQERTSPVVDGNWREYIPTTITKEKLEYALRRLYLSYYLSPHRVWKTIRTVKDFRILSTGFLQMVRFLFRG